MMVFPIKKPVLVSILNWHMTYYKENIQASRKRISARIYPAETPYIPNARALICWDHFRGVRRLRISNGGVESDL